MHSFCTSSIFERAFNGLVYLVYNVHVSSEMGALLPVNANDGQGVDADQNGQHLTGLDQRTQHGSEYPSTQYKGGIGEGYGTNGHQDVRC